MMKKVYILLFILLVFSSFVHAQVCNVVIWHGFENGLNDMATTGSENDALTLSGNSAIISDPTGIKGGNVLRLTSSGSPAYAYSGISADTVQPDSWTISGKFYSVDPAYHPGGWWDLFQTDNARLKSGGGVSSGVSTFGVISDSQPAGQSWQAPQGGWFNSSTDIHGSMWGFMAATWEQNFVANTTYFRVYIYDLAGNQRYTTSASWSGIHTSSDWRDGILILNGSTNLFPNGIYVDDLCLFNGALDSTQLSQLASGVDPHIVANPNPENPQLKGPLDQGEETNGWKLDWEAGTGGPYTFDVFLGTDYQAVVDADDSLGICPPNYPSGDFNQDCLNNMDDLLLLADTWVSAANMDEFADLAGDWLTGNMFKGNQSETEYWHSDLEIGQTYYWRVDQRDGVDVISTDVWSFDVVEAWTLDEFMIGIGWPGIESCSNKTGYVQNLANLGINLVHDAESVIDTCWNAGIKVMIYRDPASLAALARQYRDHPGNWGYFVSDEPDDPYVPYVGEFHLRNHWADPTHPSYTNIQSINYGKSESYVYNFVDTVNPEILSFDFYHWYWWKWKNGWPTLIENLEFFRSVAVENNIPLVSWVEIDPDGTSGTSPSDEVRRKYRYSSYLAITYGAKGIMWFSASFVFDTISGTISKSGYYSDMQTVNTELANLGSELVNLNSTAVYNTGIGSRSGDYSSTMVPVPGGHWIQIDEDGFALGMFENASGDEYAMVTNRDYQNSRTATIRFPLDDVTQVEALDATTGTWINQTISGTYPNQSISITMDPSLGKLLRITK